MPLVGLQPDAITHAMTLRGKQAPENKWCRVSMTAAASCTDSHGFALQTQPGHGNSDGQTRRRMASIRAAAQHLMEMVYSVVTYVKSSSRLDSIRFG